MSIMQSHYSIFINQINEFTLEKKLEFACVFEVISLNYATKML